VESHLLLIVATAFVNNVVLVKMLGLCPFMDAPKKLEVSFALGAATAFVLTLACGVSYLLDRYLLVPFDLTYLRTLAFIMIIAGTVQFTERFIEKAYPAFYQLLGIYVPLVTSNCAILGIPLLNAQAKHSFVESMLFGLGNAIGFSLVLVMFGAMRDRLESANVPQIFKGNAIAMITAGIMSIAFMGFAGIIR
jgi:electron transport complex protein RnfA